MTYVYAQFLFILQAFELVLATKYGMQPAWDADNHTHNFAPKKTANAMRRIQVNRDCHIKMQITRDLS